MSFIDPFLNAFTEVFEAFGVPSDLAPIVTTIVLILFLLYLFLMIIGSFEEVNDSNRMYLFIIFFVGLCVLGLLPMWTLLATIIGGATYLLVSYLVGGKNE